MTDTSNSGGGYGQMTPSDTASDYNGLWFTIQQALGLISTMKIVKVMSVTNDGGVAAVGFVDVLPLVNQVDGNGNATKQVTVFGLPYFRLQGGTNAIIVDPKVGDIGIAVVADRDISAVKANKDQANPGSRRKFSLSDGVYIGGIIGAAPVNYLQIKDDVATLAMGSGVSLRATTDGITITAGSNNIEITAAAIQFNGPVIFNGVATGVGGTVDFGSSVLKTAGAADVGSVASSGDVTAGAISLETHVHAGVTTGGESTGPPV